MQVTFVPSEINGTESNRPGIVSKPQLKHNNTNANIALLLLLFYLRSVRSPPTQRNLRRLSTHFFTSSLQRTAALSASSKRKLLPRITPPACHHQHALANTLLPITFCFLFCRHLRDLSTSFHRLTPTTGVLHVKLHCGVICTHSLAW